MHRSRSLVIISDLSIVAGISLLAIMFMLNAGVGTGYSWDWTWLSKYLLYQNPPEGHFWENLNAGLLLTGVLNTLRISFWSFLLAGIFGVVGGLFRVWRNLFARLVGITYVGMVRNIPPLVLLSIFYYFIVSQLSLDGSSFLWIKENTIIGFLLPEGGSMTVFISAVFALALYEGAYIAEIVRGGIESVSKDQWEAAKSLGFGNGATLRRVIIPQAVPSMLPALTSQFASLIKDSSIVAIISVRELTFTGREIVASTYMMLEVWVTVTVLYLVLCLTVSFIGNILERRVRWKF